MTYKSFCAMSNQAVTWEDDANHPAAMLTINVQVEM